MYAATVNGRPLTFTVSGLLWNRSLVMQDVETQSLWSHILGRAMDGQLQGAELEILPAVMTDWRSWREEHPDTTVLALSRTAQEYLAEFQKRPDTFVLGINLAGKAKAYPFDLLAREIAVNDQLGNLNVVVTFDPQSTEARMFDAKVNDRVLTFRPHTPGTMQDQETESIWSTRRGESIDGPLQGTQLRHMSAIVSYGRVWREFFPDSEVYQPRIDENRRE